MYKLAFLYIILHPRRISADEYSGAFERRGQRGRSAERSADPAIRAAMAGRAGAAGLQRRALRHHSAVQLLEHRIPQQAAGVHQAESHPAVGREFRRVRQAERRAQRHAVRLCRVCEGWQSGPQVEAGDRHGGGQLHEIQQCTGTRTIRDILPARARQTIHRRAADGERELAAVFRHRRLVPVRVQ